MEWPIFSNERTSTVLRRLGRHREDAREPRRQHLWGGGDRSVPVADDPLVAEVGAPETEDGSDDLADARADGRLHL